jgi:hypothetical protein
LACLAALYQLSYLAKQRQILLTPRPR